MSDSETQLLTDQQVETLIQECGERDLVDHMEYINDTISDFIDNTRHGNIVYAQRHVLEKAVELLREEYDDADHYGEHEAEMMATAIILETEIENGGVWDI